MADLTAYLNDTQSKLGNQAVVNKSGNTTYRVKASTVEVWVQPTYSTWSSAAPTSSLDLIHNRETLTATHAFNNVPDGVVSDLKLILDRKLSEYGLNRPKPR